MLLFGLHKLTVSACVCLCVSVCVCLQVRLEDGVLSADHIISALPAKGKYDCKALMVQQQLHSELP